MVDTVTTDIGAIGREPKTRMGLEHTGLISLSQLKPLELTP